MSALSAVFAEPAREARGDGMIPFLAITGRPTEAEVRAKVASIQAQGMESFLIYARSGLQLEYMGEDWLKLCVWFCDEAEKRGLKVWLYDEYNWPSGTCKGRVPQENDAWRYREYGVFADGKGGFRWDEAYAPAGWVNVYEPGATDRFIELTHEVYAKRLARWFANKTVLGIFTDEPGHPTRVTFPAGKPLVSLRAYSGLEDEYRTRTGRDLRADVEAWLRDKSAAKAEVWEHYAALLGKRFRAMYFDKLRTWCDAHGILLTGHMISEDDLVGSCIANGDPILCLRGESLPGMDEIRTGYDPSPNAPGVRGIEWVTFNVARQAILHRGNGGLVELFACGPGDLTPGVLRQLIWMSAFHGIDHYITCMDVMDEKGMVEKHGYLAAAGPLHPWYAKHANVLADDARIAAEFARKRVSEREVGIRYPNRAAARATFAKARRPNLKGLLRVLELNQFTCRLLAEDETYDLPLVFACNTDGTYDEEKMAGRGLTAEQALALCRQRLVKTFEVEEVDGRPADDLLVRTYADGTSAVVNMKLFTTRRLVAVRGAKRSIFEIPAHGIRTFAAGELPTDEKSFAEIRPLADAKWTVTRDRPNLLRVNFTAEKKGVVRFVDDVVARPVLRDCALAYAVTKSGRPIGLNEQAPKGETVLRHDAIPYAFTADGVKLEGTPGAADLPGVYSPLYRTASARTWTTGAHVFEIVSGEADNNFFLPALWLAGDFRVLDGCIFRETKDVSAAFGSFAALGYPHYAGALTWRAEVTAPAGARLRAETGKCLVSAKFCGVELGVRAWAPFEWEIPAELQGRKGVLELTVYSSAQPMFGAYETPGATWDMRLWMGEHVPDPACGLFSAAWVK